MKKYLATILFTTICACLVSSSCLAYQSGSYSVGSRTVDLRWQQTKERGHYVIELYGDVRGGSNCDQLNIKVYMSNSNNGAAISRLVGSIRNYSMSNHLFQAQDTVYPQKGDGNSWVVDDVYLKCL